MLAIVVALLLAFGGVVALAPVYIGLLQRLGFGKQIRAEGPAGHFTKAGTPTMGGMLMIVVVMFLAMAMRIEDVSTLTPMLTLVGVGILGALDDYVNAQTGIGMRGRYKLVWQTVVALLAAWYIQRHFSINEISVPLVGDVGILPILFIVFVAFVIVAMSNGVNLTDGLDGLAGGVLIFSFVAYLLIALVLAVPQADTNSTPNLAIFCALIIGALMGFLWFNVHPAQLFMGDSGRPGAGRHAGRGGDHHHPAPAAGGHRRGLPGGDVSASCCRSRRSSCAGGGSSAWPPCSTTSSWSAGPRRRSRCASGSSPPWPDCWASASSWPP